MRVTIIGSGAMACLFGARLAEAAEITLVGSWRDGIAALREFGIRLEDEGEGMQVPVKAVILGEAVEPADLVLVLVKAWKTAEVARHLEVLLRPDGMALTLQNGLGNRELLGERAFLGVTTLGATLLGPGRVRTGGTGSVFIAAPDSIVNLFLRAGLQASRVDQARAEGLLWGKLVVNCGINPLTAILKVPNGELLSRPDASIVMERAALECADVALARGIALPFRDPVLRTREIARQTASNLSSMLQDILRGAPTECEAINGSVVRLGKSGGVPTPVNEVLYHLVKALAGSVDSGMQGGMHADGR